MSSASPATFGLLGMLATRSWTAYELTQQVRRSLRFVWPVSEGHLYREQKNLVALGWATLTVEPAGRRTRKRYAITPEGRVALKNWLGSEPEEPHLQIEGVLRAFYADSGGPAELAASLTSTAAAAAAMLAELHGFVEDYLSPGGPLEMLEQGLHGGWHEGREVFPDRLHAVSLALDVTTRLLATIEEFSRVTAAEVASWPGTADPALTPATRARLERVRTRSAPRS